MTSSTSRGLKTSFYYLILIVCIKEHTINYIYHYSWNGSTDVVTMTVYKPVIINLRWMNLRVRLYFSLQSNSMIHWLHLVDQTWHDTNTLFVSARTVVVITSSFHWSVYYILFSSHKSYYKNTDCSRFKCNKGMKLNKLRADKSYLEGDNLMFLVGSTRLNAPF